MPQDINSITNLNAFSIVQSLSRKRKKKIPRLKKWLYPYANENEHIKNYKDVVRTIETFYRSIDEQLQYIIEINLDDVSDDIESRIALIREFSKEEIKNFEPKSRETAYNTLLFNQKQWEKIVKNAFDVDILLSEPWVQGTVESFVKENVAQISKLSNEYINNISAAVQAGYRNGETWRTISKRIETETRVKKSKADFLGTDQINKLNGQVTKKRQTDLGLAKYVWSDSNDIKVRKTHHAMDGRLCIWEDPTVYLDAKQRERKRSSIGGVELHTGQDYRCRCTAQPYFDDFLQFL